jgi:hypothetical protein
MAFDQNSGIYLSLQAELVRELIHFDSVFVGYGPMNYLIHINAPDPSA